MLKKTRCMCLTQNFSPMPVLEMRKLCLNLARWTYTNKSQRMFIRNFFNKRLTNKYMRVDETYVILDQYLHFSEFTSKSSMYGFWFKKINTIIAYMNLFWFLNQNYKLQFEKWICWQSIFTSRILCTFTELNQLIFR